MEKSSTESPAWNFLLGTLSLGILVKDGRALVPRWCRRPNRPLLSDLRGRSLELILTCPRDTRAILVKDRCALVAHRSWRRRRSRDTGSAESLTRIHPHRSLRF